MCYISRVLDYIFSLDVRSAYPFLNQCKSPYVEDVQLCIRLNLSNFSGTYVKDELSLQTTTE